MSSHANKLLAIHFILFCYWFYKLIGENKLCLITNAGPDNSEQVLTINLLCIFLQYFLLILKDKCIAYIQKSDSIGIVLASLTGVKLMDSGDSGEKSPSKDMEKIFFPTFKFVIISFCTWKPNPLGPGNCSVPNFCKTNFRYFSSLLIDPHAAGLFMPKKSKLLTREGWFRVFLKLQIENHNRNYNIQYFLCYR